MNNLQEILAEITNSSLYIELLEAKNIIASNPVYLEEYKEILMLQKKLVQEEVKNEVSTSSKLRLEYLFRLEQLKSKPVVKQYLALLDELNQLIHSVEGIINDQLNLFE
ncbi:MAG: YlbF family regulator [Candidatus Izemoplasmatales bacterium]|jgi:cell fate (sporulation/competence/biofilm development) regulator YmcA (YheA/YmcA/DUF963 family)|nr:YlbF family regulator [Candidatus Izemoplasmatales bacterium]